MLTKDQKQRIIDFGFLFVFQHDFESRCQVRGYVTKDGYFFALLEYYGDGRTEIMFPDGYSLGPATDETISTVFENVVEARNRP